MKQNEQTNEKMNPSELKSDKNSKSFLRRFLDGLKRQLSNSSEIAYRIRKCRERHYQRYGYFRILAPLTLLSISAAIPTLLFAEGAVISDIGEAVNKLSRILLVVIAACGVWSGVKLAKGDQDAIPRLISCVAGAIVVGVAAALINYFKV